MSLRRTCLGLLTAGALTSALLAGGIPAAGAATGDAPTKTLKQLAKPTGVRVGTAVDMDALAADATYSKAVGAQFNTVTPENVMKWEVVEPKRDQLDFTQADQLVAFAKAHKQKVRGHTLVWHSQVPAWLTDGVASGDIGKKELRRILKRHVKTEVRHFKGDIWAWDVVNEAFNDDGTMRDSLWLQELGPGYIADAFRWAHQADPKARLFLNDYNNEGINAKSDAYYALVKQLQAQHVPVGGYGIQGHLALQYDYPATVTENLRRFDQLGLQTAFTEVDIRMILPADAIKAQAQANEFAGLLRSCLLTRHCVSYTVWGFADNHSWVPGVFDGQGSATPYDENLTPKPAYYALRDTLAIAGR